MNHYYYVYILASKMNGTLYVGVSRNLPKRVYEHRNGLAQGFTQQYRVHNLVYYEVFEEIKEAIEREKQLKNWKRSWKIKLIESKNQTWEDLYDEVASGW